MKTLQKHGDTLYYKVKLKKNLGHKIFTCNIQIQLQLKYAQRHDKREILQMSIPPPRDGSMIAFVSFFQMFCIYNKCV